jgi:hypothetical protein
MSDEVVVNAVSAANVKAARRAHHDEIPSRLAGSANGKRMAEYSAAALTQGRRRRAACTRCRGW